MAAGRYYSEHVVLRTSSLSTYYYEECERFLVLTNSRYPGRIFPLEIIYLKLTACIYVRSFIKYYPNITGSLSLLAKLTVADTWADTFCHSSSCMDTECRLLATVNVVRFGCSQCGRLTDALAHPLGMRSTADFYKFGIWPDRLLVCRHCSLPRQQIYKNFITDVHGI